MFFTVSDQHLQLQNILGLDVLLFDVGPRGQTSYKIFVNKNGEKTGLWCCNSVSSGCRIAVCSICTSKQRNMRKMRFKN